MKHKGNIDLEGNDMVDVGKITPTAASITVFDDESFDLVYLFEDATDATKTMTANDMAVAFHNITVTNRAAETASFITSFDNVANANLTANATRTLDLNGNTMTFDVNGGEFFFKEVGTAHTYLEATFGELKLQGLTYPSSDGTNGQVLTTNGAGVLTFTTVSGGGGGTPLATADQTLTADRTIDTNGYNLSIELDATGTADTFTIHDGTNDLFEVNTNTSGTLFSVNDVSGLPTFQSVDNGTMVLPKILTAAPTGTPTEGTMQLAIVSGTCYLYVYINGGWKKTTLS